VSCSVTDGKCSIRAGSPEFTALKACSGMLNYQDEVQKLDLERQEQVEAARKKLNEANYVEGYKITPKGERALNFLEECKIT